jgi:hypothetical protein
LFENDEHVIDSLVDSMDSIESIDDQTQVFVSRDCISLEYFFTRDDQRKNHDLTEETSIAKVQDTKNINISTHDFPKYINLGTSCKKEEIDEYTSLLKEFYDFFSWTYDDLKEYDKSIFHHIIPLEEGMKHVKQ